jgi:hypothetical protein
MITAAAPMLIADNLLAPLFYRRCLTTPKIYLPKKEPKCFGPSLAWKYGTKKLLTNSLPTTAAV